MTSEPGTRSAGPGTVPGFWDGNLTLLERLDRELATRIHHLPSGAHCVVDRTPSGEPTLQLQAQDGVSIRLHSAHAPLQEGVAFAQARIREGPEAYVLSGMGLGYHVREFARRLRPQTWLLVVEAREDLFRAALESVDLADLLKRPRTRFFVGTDWTGYLGWLHRFLQDSEVFELELVTYPPSVRLAPDFYTRVSVELETAVNRRTVELNTLVHHGELIEANAIRNIAFMPGSFGVSDFAQQLKGKPGIVVASGPSLNANLEGLKSARDRAVVITVGKSLRLLSEHQVIPEFCAALDMSRASQEVFKGYEVPSATRLVYDSDCYHEVVRTYPGPLVCFDTIAAVMKWASSVIGSFGFMDKGLSVAHTAFFFARALGLDPIILVGVDLALPGNRTHAEGVTMTWGGEIDAKDPNLIEVPSVSGGSVRTYRAFHSFVTAFETEIARTKVRVINTSTGGALIRGAESLSLADALERHALRGERISESLRGVSQGRLPFDRAAFYRAADRLVDSLQRLRDRASQGGRLISRSRRLSRGNRLEREEFRKMMKRIDTFKKQLLEDPASMYVMRLLSGTALRTRELAKQAGSLTDVEKRLDIELEWAGEIFSGYEHSTRFFLAEFGRMREELRERIGRAS